MGNDSPLPWLTEWCSQLANNKRYPPWFNFQPRYVSMVLHQLSDNVHTTHESMNTPLVGDWITGLAAFINFYIMVQTAVILSNSASS